MSVVRACGAPKPFDRLICETCVCDGYEDTQKLAMNAKRVIASLELMKEPMKSVKIEPLLKLLKDGKL
jgi:hypothetical protein